MRVLCYGLVKELHKVSTVLSRNELQRYQRASWPVRCATVQGTFVRGQHSRTVAAFLRRGANCRPPSLGLQACQPLLFWAVQASASSILAPNRTNTEHISQARILEASTPGLQPTNSPTTGVPTISAHASLLIPNGQSGDRLVW